MAQTTTKSRKSSQSTVRFDKILVDCGAVSRAQLQSGFALQRRTSRLRIGEVLVAMGLLAVHDLMAALQRHTVDLPGGKAPARLGSLLIAQGAITEEVLELALARQKAGDPRVLGRILIDEGFITSRDLIRGLGIQAKLRHATIMAVLGASLNAIQPQASRAEDMRGTASTVEISLTIAPRMSLTIEDADLRELLSVTDVIQLPSIVELPDMEGHIATVVAEPLSADLKPLVLRNAAGDAIPFSMHIVSPENAERSRLLPGNRTMITFPNTGGGGQPILELDLSAGDLKKAQASGYHATVVIMLEPRL